MPDPQIMWQGSRVTDVGPCDEPNGWPEFEMTLSFRVEHTDDLELVAQLAGQQMMALDDVLLREPSDEMVQRAAQALTAARIESFPESGMTYEKLDQVCARAALVAGLMLLEEGDHRG